MPVAAVAAAQRPWQRVPRLTGASRGPRQPHQAPPAPRTESGVHEATQTARTSGAAAPCLTVDARRRGASRRAAVYVMEGAPTVRKRRWWRNATKQPGLKASGSPREGGKSWTTPPEKTTESWKHRCYARGYQRQAPRTQGEAKKIKKETAIRWVSSTTPSLPRRPTRDAELALCLFRRAVGPAALLTATTHGPGRCGEAASLARVVSGPDGATLPHLHAPHHPRIGGHHITLGSVSAARVEKMVFPRLTVAPSPDADRLPSTPSVPAGVLERTGSCSGVGSKVCAGARERGLQWTGNARQLGEGPRANITQRADRKGRRPTTVVDGLGRTQLTAARGSGPRSAETSDSLPIGMAAECSVVRLGGGPTPTWTPVVVNYPRRGPCTRAAARSRSDEDAPETRDGCSRG